MTSPMSAMGQKRTFSDTLSNVCFWGQSGRSRAARCMSAYSQKRTFNHPTLLSDGFVSLYVTPLEKLIEHLTKLARSRENREMSSPFENI